MRKIVLIGSILVFSVIVVFISMQIKKKLNLKEQASKAIKTLNNFKVTTLDNSEVYMHDLIGDDQNVVVVLFGSDCDHCIYELDEFKKHGTEFKNIKTVFLSLESTEKLRKVKEEQQIADFISVANISSAELSANFGSVAWPSIFLYNSNKQLIKNFTGETDVRFILQAIHLP